MKTKETKASNGSYTLLGNVVFSKDLFIETMNEIEKQHRHDSKCSEAFRVIFPNDYISNYANHWLQNQLVKVLQIAMNDNHKDSWIEYYMWELDFGLKYSKGCVQIQGKDFELKTASDLWDLLKIMNKEQNLNDPKSQQLNIAGVNKRLLFAAYLQGKRDQIYWPSKWEDYEPIGKYRVMKQFLKWYSTVC